MSKEEKKINKGIAAGGALSALGAKGAYDAHQIGKGFDRWGKSISTAAESAQGPKQIDAVYDAYIKGGKGLSNRRFLGMKSGNVMNKIVDSVNKGRIPFLGKDVSLAGDAAHYSKFTGTSEKNLKNYMTDKGVRNNFEGKFTGKANVIKNNPNLSISQKIKAMEDANMTGAAREFSKATGKFGGEMLGIPGKYEKTLAPHLKKVKGVGAGVAALGAGVAGVSALTGNKKEKDIMKKTASKKLNYKEVKSTPFGDFLLTNKPGSLDMKDYEIFRHETGEIHPVTKSNVVDNNIEFKDFLKNSDPSSSKALQSLSNQINESTKKTASWFKSLEKYASPNFHDQVDAAANNEVSRARKEALKNMAGSGAQMAAFSGAVDFLGQKSGLLQNRGLRSGAGLAGLFGGVAAGLQGAREYGPYRQRVKGIRKTQENIKNSRPSFYGE